MFCKNCGTEVHDKQAVCVKCGVMVKNETSSGKKDKTVAALLALFLGGIGIHKFYLSQPIAGIFYIVFCWTFIPSLLGIIEGILYLISSQESFDKKYN